MCGGVSVWGDYGARTANWSSHNEKVVKQKCPSPWRTSPASCVCVGVWWCGLWVVARNERVVKQRCSRRSAVWFAVRVRQDPCVSVTCCWRPLLQSSSSLSLAAAAGGCCCCLLLAAAAVPHPSVPAGPFPHLPPPPASLLADTPPLNPN